jgi:hypothetical protein
MHLIWALIDHYYTLIDYMRLPGYWGRYQR